MQGNKLIELNFTEQAILLIFVRMHVKKTFKNYNLLKFNADSNGTIFFNFWYVFAEI